MIINKKIKTLKDIDDRAFSIGCGAITAIIRLWGGYPEGVSYAISMMNAATPIIDRYTKNKIYGTR